MSEVLPRFALERPATAAAAVALHGGSENARYIAGGTDLLVNIRRGLGEPEVLIDVSAIEGLKTIDAEAKGAAIGAGVTLAQLAEDETIAKAFPALSTAAESIAAPGHRETGTVGGNLCLDTRCVFYNQSQWWRSSNDFCLKYEGTICHVAPKGTVCHAAFSGDLAAVLLVLGADIEITGPKEKRRIPLAELYSGVGDDHLTLAPGDLVTTVHLKPAALPVTYEKMRVRGSIDFPLAGVAVGLSMKGNRVETLSVGVTGTNTRPFLVEGTEAFAGEKLDDDALDRLAELVQKQVSPMRTTLIRPFARRRIAGALARRQAAALAQV